MKVLELKDVRLGIILTSKEIKDLEIRIKELSQEIKQATENMNKEQLLNAREEWKIGDVKRAEKKAEKIIKKWQKSFIKNGCNCINATSLSNIEFDIIKNKLNKKGFEFVERGLSCRDFYNLEIVITNL